MTKKEMLGQMEELRSTCVDICTNLWNNPESGGNEQKSADMIRELLHHEGFVIVNEEHLPHAFYAEYGSGKPVIAVLGEYDALPGLSQKCQITKEPVTPGAAGHGCGHNLLGTGAMEAACVIKQYIEENNIKATVRYYGCPAEESGAGKAFMVREGCFNDVDFAYAWHPMFETGIMNKTLANVRVIYDFTGKSSHAAACPEDGRSALDACELMNVGVNYLREHVKTDSRMHYAYLNAGGSAPNIVPHKATLLYALRAPKASYVKELIERVSDVARGAALMTGTKVDIRVVSAYADFLSVPAMDMIMEDSIIDSPLVEYTDEEYKYASQFNSKEYDLKDNIDASYEKGKKSIPIGSTDVADVSWIAPMGSITVTTMAKDSTMHGWSVVAQGKSSIAHKGMHRAAGILAQAALRVIESPELQKKIKEDFNKSKAGEEYGSLLPANVKPGDF